jgi:hypothetical protein
VTLIEASALLPQARRIHALERRRLLALIPDGELLLTGSTSLPGMLTRGDVDLHLRVPAARFEAAVAVLRERYTLVHPDIWTDGFATFETAAYDLPTGIALTAIDDEHDRRFRQTWERLANDPDSVERFNAAKRSHDQGDAAVYEAAKSAFVASLDVDEGSGSLSMSRTSSKRTASDSSAGRSTTSSSVRVASSATDT